MEELIEDYLKVNSHNDAVQCGLHDLNSLLLQIGKSLIDYGILLPEVEVMHYLNMTSIKLQPCVVNLNGFGKFCDNFCHFTQ